MRQLILAAALVLFAGTMSAATLEETFDQTYNVQTGALLSLGTTNGHITLARCGGDVDAETTNGGINAELLEVTPGKAVRLETTNGRISLAAPPTLAASIDAANTNGSINTELPVTSTRMRRHTLHGTINGGGPEVRLRTTNGSIEIRAAR